MFKKPEVYKMAPKMTLASISNKRVRSDRMKPLMGDRPQIRFIFQNQPLGKKVIHMRCGLSVPIG